MTDHQINGPREILRDYKFINLLGSGSFGKVHKVQSKTNPKNIYACKEIEYSKMTEKEKKLLVHEVNTLRDLHHENIVRYIDRYLDKPNQKLYILMEYCENGDLARYIKRHLNDRKYISEEKIWSVFVQLIRALDYCHSMVGQKIIHRDIKPGNVMLCHDGSVKLGDFGLCRTLNEESKANTNVGTPLYMSPELLAKQQYTEKVDIWSLGCVMHELCSLQPPFVAQNMDSLKLKVRTGTKTTFPSAYSSALKNLIESMLSHDPTRRPSTKQILENPKIQEMMVRMNIIQKKSETQQVQPTVGLPPAIVPRSAIPTTGVPANVTTNQVAKPTQQAMVMQPGLGLGINPSDSEQNSIDVERTPAPTGIQSPLPQTDLSVEGLKEWQARLREREIKLLAKEEELNAKERDYKLRLAALLKRERALNNEPSN